MAVIGTLKSWVAGNKVKASDLNANFTDIKTSVNAAYTLTGALASLTTTVKTSLVLAINELVTSIAGKMSVLSAPQTKTADYTIKDLEEIWVDSTSNAVPITLPHTAVHVRIVWIAGTNDVTILPQSGTFNGSASYVMKTLNDSVDCKSSAADTYRWF